MEMFSQSFGFLEGMSPWWWVALAFGLAALEMATFSFFLIWPALAALCMAALTAASPTLSAGVQVITFSAISIALTYIGRLLFLKYGDGGGEGDATLNQRGARFIGRVGKVLEFANGEGVIELEGMRWRAKWADGQTSKVGNSARVTQANGMVLDVEAVD
ncbi:NfeD family protein [Paramylibacter kogurei]|nr:NfeD family protein [Amylibacter kogurei]